MKAGDVALSLSQVFKVIHTGFEPVTSSLSRKRSKPTELMDLIYDCVIRAGFVRVVLSY